MLWLTPLALAGEPHASLDGCDTTDRALVAVYNDAAEAFNANEMKAARSGMDKVLKRSPACRGALAVAVAARLGLLDPDAVPLARRAMGLYPTDPAFPAQIAEAAFVAQAFDAALDAALAARALDPSYQPAALWAFRAYLRLGRYDDALALADDFPGFDGAARDCLRVTVLADQSRMTEAEALRDSCAAATDPVRAAALAALSSNVEEVAGIATEMGVSNASVVAAAMEHFNAGRYREAVEALERALAAEPWNALLRLQLAMACLQSGQQGRARRELQALYDAPTWVTRWQSGAISGVVTKGGERELEEALQQAFGQLVVLLLAQGDVEGAGVALRKAEARFGRVAALAAARARLTSAAEGPVAGWQATASALAAFPDESSLVSAAGILAFDNATGVPPAVAEAIATRGQAADHYNLVAGYARAQLNAECARYGQRLAASVLVRDEGRGLVYGCLLSLGDLAAAGALLDEHGVALDPRQRLWHAELLIRDGQPEAALAVAGGLDANLEGRADLRVEALRRLERLDEALAASRGATLQPATRYNLGIEFYNRQRQAELAEVLRGFDCASLPSVAKDCRAVLASVRK